MNNNKMKILYVFIVIALIGIICGVAIGLSSKNREVIYMTDNEYLYDVAIDYLNGKYTQESQDKEKDDFQIFFDYKGFGISQKEDRKYAYMWILEESYYVENGELKTGSGSSMPYKITFENDKVVDYQIPMDGSYYASSIREMFPNDIENQILQYHLDNTNLQKKVAEHYSYINSADSTAEYHFLAEIIEANENYIIVRPDANSREIKSSDKISIGITRPINGVNDFYVVGNKVKITYSGIIMETYPAQIDAIKIELVSTDGQAENYTTKVAYANYSSNNLIMSECLNKESMLISSAQHLPVYKFETKTELDEFKNKFKDIYTMSYGYDEVPAFNVVTEDYDDEFFKNHTLILTYISASSGSFRYKINNIKKENETLNLNVSKINNPAVYTTDMSGWFLIAEIDKEYINGCNKYDAQLER